MSNILIAILIGIAAGTIDVIPMIIMKLDKTANLSAFLHYFALGIIIPFVNWGLEQWLTGIIIAFLTTLPVMIIAYEKDKKSWIPMTIFALILGAGIGLTGAAYIN